LVSGKYRVLTSETSFLAYVVVGEFLESEFGVLIFYPSDLGGEGGSVLPVAYRGFKQF